MVARALSLPSGPRSSDQALIPGLATLDTKKDVLVTESGPWPSGRNVGPFFLAVWPVCTPNFQVLTKWAVFIYLFFLVDFTEMGRRRNMNSLFHLFMHLLIACCVCPDRDHNRGYGEDALTKFPARARSQFLSRLIFFLY